MRVLMLGWEFPPSINGGLGTACAGLVRALDDAGTEVVFVSPEPVEPEPLVEHAQRIFRPVAPTSDEPPSDDVRLYQHVTFRDVPVQLSPYEVVRSTEYVVWRPAGPTGGEPASAQVQPTHAPDDTPPEAGLLADVRRYGEAAEAIAADELFDVIHAHDWMSFPAALAIAERSGKPVIAHVHSLESDRGGPGGDTRIADIERRGVHGAGRIVAVSQFTKDALVRQYGVSPDKIEVVYNAVEPPPMLRLGADDFSIREHDKIILFMGRLTMQKGPEYFITAARKVLEVMDDVKFVMAGDGDLARQTVELAAMFGIAHKVIFTGFLRGLDVERIFQIADLFVMPSVSEPFGIAPLEAIARNVPTIISKQSGVSEVLKHALKVDFWDTNELANKMVAVLRHPSLAKMLREDGGRDVAKLSWAAAAKHCEQIYASLIPQAASPVRG